MNKQTLSFTLELLMWLVTILIAAGVLYPIWQKAPNYPFWTPNIAFILIFITTTRYIFLLKHTWLAYLQPVKLFLIVLSIPLIFYLINEINFFQTYLDEYGVEEFLGHLNLSQQAELSQYIRNEMLLFGTGSLIAAFLLPIRMIMSIWRTRNRGTV